MEIKIDGVFDLSESELSSVEFQKELLNFIESKNVYFGGAFYDLNENGEVINDIPQLGIVDFKAEE